MKLLAFVTGPTAKGRLPENRRVRLFGCPPEKTKDTPAKNTNSNKTLPMNKHLCKYVGIKFLSNMWDFFFKNELAMWNSGLPTILVNPYFLGS